MSGDSQLVAKQVDKGYKTSTKTMAAHLVEVQKLEHKFIGFRVKYIPTKDNCLDDNLSRLASSRSVSTCRCFATCHNLRTVTESKYVLVSQKSIKIGIRNSMIGKDWILQNSVCHPKAG